MFVQFYSGEQGTVSDSKDLDKEDTRIVNVLMDNDFKKSKIMKVKKRIEKGRVQQSTETREENAEAQKYLSIPYVPSAIETLHIL